MKKLFFIAAIAGAALVSCTKNELAPSATKQYELTFASPVSQVITKGVALTPTTYPTDATYNFAVFADYHKDLYTTTIGATNPTSLFTSYMRNGEGVPVGYNHSDAGVLIDDVTFTDWWAPVGKKYYWPMDGYLTFAAYSPASINTTAEIAYNITNGIVINDYEVSQTAVGTTVNQVDLMLSDRATDQKRPYTVANNQNVSGTANDGVHIAFNHVLSAISFLFKTAEDYTVNDYTITLKTLTIKNAYTKADLTQFSGLDMTALELDATQYATLWSDYKGVANNVVYNSSLELDDDGKRLDSNETNKADILLIPQALNHSATEKVQLEIVYTVSHPDMGSTGEGASAVQNSIEYTKTLDLATSAVASWAAGTRYLYTITIGMNEIHFAPTVTDWVPEIDTPITF